MVNQALTFLDLSQPWQCFSSWPFLVLQKAHLQEVLESSTAFRFVEMAEDPMAWLNG